MLYPSVMLVDDDAVLLIALSDFLRFHLPGIRIDQVKFPRAALAKIKARPYDTVVIDLRMKEPEGFALLREANALRPDMPVVVLSGHIDATLASQAFKMGVHDVLPKGVNRAEFLVVLKSALEIHRLSRAVRARHFVIGRLCKRVEQLNRLIICAQARSNIMTGVQRMASASRALTGKSLASLEHAMDLLWQRARMVEATRDNIQERLTALQHECRDRIVNRIASGIV
jgi:DNA-binding NtrC family response regulator